MKTLKKRRFKRPVRLIKALKKMGFYSFLFLACCFLFVLYADWRIIRKSNPFLYTSVEKIPHNKVGLLLGTAKILPGNRINLYFQYRIDAATQLWEAGKVDYFIVSGDNSTKHYNEPLDMKKSLIERGVPEDRIYLDYAGFRTFDSMVRAEKIFGQTSYTVISQKFHVQRAVYIGRRLKQDVIGYCAKDVTRFYGFKTRMREKLARVKVFTDFIIGKKPKFLGDSVEVGPSQE
jgi:SanA protein